MRWLTILLAASALPISAQPPDIEEYQRFNQKFHEAREHADKGEFAEAFRAFLSIPGGEFAAARLARKHPDIAKNELGKIKKPPPRVLLIEADFDLASGNKKKALAKLRAFASLIAPEDSDNGWDDGAVPREYYPVEPPNFKDAGWDQSAPNWHMPAFPFQTGPGSHVDNWLIRRFIALEAWDDAAAEFDRIQNLHQKRPGPDPLAFQFALDYAFFLIGREEKDKAFTLLAGLFSKIDLDKKPETPGFRLWSRPGLPLGISHDEFIRLAYGAFKSAGREAPLVKQLEVSKENLAKLVLAKIRIHEGQLDDALKLELAFIEAGDFSPVSTSIRRGLVYKSLKYHAEAAAAFEKALTLPPEGSIDLPTEARAIRDGFSSQFIPQQPIFQGAQPVDGAPKATYLEMVLTLLEKTYGALGNPDKVFTTKLRRWDANPIWANTFGSVEALAQLAMNTGLDADFAAWARNARADTKKFSPEARANIAWVLDDLAGTLGALEEAAKTYKNNPIPDLDGWLKRLDAKGGKAQKKMLLEVLIAADPDQNRYRLELLNLAGDDTTPETLITLYESLLAPGAEPVFRRGKGTYNTTQFDNHFDLAHRLMRLYVRTGQREKMEALGLRMAEPEAPFDKPDPYNNHGHDERAMAYLIAESGAKSLVALKPILNEELWPHAKAQLVWTLAGGVAGSLKRFTPPAEIPWHGIADAQVIVSDENTTDLARNESFVFAGQPWGVSVYDFDGNLLRRIAIGDAPLCFAADEDTLWVGTPLGLRKIDLKTWTISQMRCDQDVPEERRTQPDYNRAYFNGVVGLALRGETLWIGTRQNVRTLNTKTNELQIFSEIELGVRNAADWTWFLFEDDGKVWANSRLGSRRYDPDTDTWRAPIFPTPRDPTRLIGRIDGELWVDVFVNDELRHRPAIVDPVTLRAEPIPISAKAEPNQRRFQKDFQYYGKLNGKLVFGPDHPAFVYDPETNFLDPLPEGWDRDTQLNDSPLPPGHRYGYTRTRHDGTVVSDHKVFLPLPDGRTVLGQNHSRSPRYIYPGEDWPFESMVWETKDDSGGLFWIAPDEDPRRVSGSGLAGDTVFDAHPSDLGFWLATNAGIALADRKGRVVETFNRDHGIPVNRSTSVAEFDGKLYFASRHDDHDGALVVFDPKSSRFSTRTLIDGLASNAVESVTAKDDHLVIKYGVQYRRYESFGYHQFPPSTYHPKTGQFSKRPADPEIIDQRTAGERAMRKRLGTLPLLGGSIIAKHTFADQTWLLGTRGAIILEGKDQTHEFALKMPEIKASVAPGSRHQLLAESRKIRKERRDLPLVEAITHANPFVVADTVARFNHPMTPEQIKMVAAKLDSKALEIRSTAATQLYRTANLESLTALKSVLDDPAPEIRAMAAIGITKLAEDPLPTEALADILASNSIGNPLFGAEGTMGIVPGRQEVFSTLASRGDDINAAVIDLLLRFPPRLVNYDHKKDFFPQLGDAVRKNPNLAKILLTAKDTRTGGTTDRDFARDVFRFTGLGILPILHGGLKSDDRIIRANAALSCGALGDPASIPLLREALDLESGLSKGAIVWALGELKARAAVPRLTELYLEACGAQWRRYNSGMHAAQAAVVRQQENRRIAKLENLSADWDEFRASAENADAPADPRHEEPLLSPQMVLEALRKIGPEHAQDFYRSIAADTQDHHGRYEAARMLAHADAGEREASIAVLRILAANLGEFRTQAAAAISLLVLNDQKAAQSAILNALGGDGKSYALHEIWERVEDKSKLNFARPQLASIAKDPTQSKHVRERAQSALTN